MIEIANSIQKIYSDVLVKEKDNTVILVLDIDDTVLSSKIGQKFVEKDITILANHIYRKNPQNLWFLTSRNCNIKRKTMNQLNRSGLIHDQKYIFYNIVCSENDNPNKGKMFMKSIYDQHNFYIIVDDDLEQVQKIQEVLERNFITNVLCYYYFPI